MDLIIDGIGRFIFEIIKLIIRDFIIQVVFYSLGYITLKIITLGIYPKKDKTSERLIYISGVVSLIIAYIVLAIIKN